MAEVRTPPVKLVDLSPHWARDHGSPEGAKQYLCFKCPCRSATCEWGGEMWIGISNPPDGNPPPKGATTRWQISGTSFADYTLVPSIWAKGHWHGHLHNGILVSC